MTSRTFGKRPRGHKLENVPDSNNGKLIARAMLCQITLAIALVPVYLILMPFGIYFHAISAALLANPVAYNLSQNEYEERMSRSSDLLRFGMLFLVFVASTGLCFFIPSQIPAETNHQLLELVMKVSALLPFAQGFVSTLEYYAVQYGLDIALSYALLGYLLVFLAPFYVLVWPSVLVEFIQTTFYNAKYASKMNWSYIKIIGYLAFILFLFSFFAINDYMFSASLRVLPSRFELFPTHVFPSKVLLFFAAVFTGSFRLLAIGFAAAILVSAAVSIKIRVTEIED